MKKKISKISGLRVDAAMAYNMNEEDVKENIKKAKKLILDSEKLIHDVVAGRGRSQKGDLSKALKDQGFFDSEPKGLKRDPQLSGGNPIDVLDDFLKQNPN